MLAALSTLASPSATVADRRRAAAALDKALSERLRPMLRDVGRSLGEDDWADVKQHVLTEASVGSSRFRGATPGEAHAWCRMVARNKALDLLKARSKMRSLSAREPDEGEPQLPEPLIEAADHAPLGREQLEQLLSLVRSVLKEASPKEGDEKADRIECLVEYQAGASIEEQIAAWAWPGGAPPASPTRTQLVQARDRVYQYRRRGQIYGREALEILAEERHLDEASLELLRLMLGLGQETS